MGLFNIFNSKTVESKYKTLLNLFKRTHKTFTIIKNEKCVVEFTMQGFEKGTLQYWSIEQYFDEPKVNAGNFAFDFSKKVTITAHTTIENQTIHIERTFNQSDDQSMMYSSVIALFLKKAKTITNNHREE